MRAFPALLLALLVTLPSVAAADESAWPTDNVRLRARPGETARVVARAEKDEELTVVATWGRWVKVRRGDRVGWLPRTQLDIRAVDAVDADKPRKRAKRSGFSGKPVADALEVTVAIDKVRGFDDPIEKKTMVLDLQRGDRATVIGRGHEGWILVEKAGVVGWIPSSSVSDGGEFASKSARPRPKAASDDGENRAPDVIVLAGEIIESAPERGREDASAPAGRLAADVMATVGAQTFAMRQTGNGDALATASGPASMVSASARVRVAGKLWVGGGTDAGMGTASLIYANAAERSDPMATRDMAVDAHASVGWGHRYHVLARAGYHYASLEIESERAEAMLVGEKVGGATVGVGGSLPVGRMRLALGLDVMPAGAIRPSELAAGTMYATSVKAAWAYSTLSYPLPARLAFALAYRGGLTAADLTDGAPAPSTASRTDQSHTLTAGLGLRW
jgi:hypothetical protein